MKTPLTAGRDVPDRRWSRVWDCYLCCIVAGHQMSHSLSCHERLSHDAIPTGRAGKIPRTVLHSSSKKRDNSSDVDVLKNVYVLKCTPTPRTYWVICNNHGAGPVQSLGHSSVVICLTRYFLARMENWFTGTQIKSFLRVAVSFMRWLFGGEVCLCIPPVAHVAAGRKDPV